MDIQTVQKSVGLQIAQVQTCRQLVRPLPPAGRPNPSPSPEWLQEAPWPVVGATDHFPSLLRLMLALRHVVTKYLGCTAELLRYWLRRNLF